MWHKTDIEKIINQRLDMKLSSLLHSPAKVGRESPHGDFGHISGKLFSDDGRNMVSCWLPPDDDDRVVHD